MNKTAKQYAKLATALTLGVVGLASACTALGMLPGIWATIAPVALFTASIIAAIWIFESWISKAFGDDD